MNSRSQELENISDQQFDLCVIGGGATGSACALDAQLRGIRTVLLEGGDFAGATSSAATKDRKSTRLNSSHQIISYAVFCLKKKKTNKNSTRKEINSTTQH